MGNHKISLTAEFSSLIKSRTNDKYNYFVSDKARKIYNIVSIFFSEKSIENIFQNRLKLSNEFDEVVERNDFDVVVEFGCGYSLRGFEYSLKNTKKIYIDTDFDEVIENKKQILTKMCNDLNIVFPSNYHLLHVDVLQDNISEKLSHYLKEKNLFLAEGLTSYFDFNEYLKFLNQMRPLLDQANNTFFSQENFLKKQTFIYKAIRSFVSVLTSSRSNLKFENKEDLVASIRGEGFNNCQAYYKNDNLFYRIN